MCKLSAAQRKEKILSIQIFLSLTNFITSVWISLSVLLRIYLVFCDIKIYRKLGSSPYQGNSRSMHTVADVQKSNSCKTIFLLFLIRNRNYRLDLAPLCLCKWSFLFSLFHEIKSNNVFQSTFVLHMQVTME